MQSDRIPLELTTERSAIVISSLKDRFTELNEKFNYGKLLHLLEHIFGIAQRFGFSDPLEWVQLHKLLVDNKQLILKLLDVSLMYSAKDALSDWEYITNKIGIKFPEIVNWPTMHKHKIVKDILTDIRNDMIASASYAVKIAQRNSIDWPEFDIIRKSFPNDLDENDNTQSRISAIIEKSIKELLRTGYLDVVVRRLEDQGLRDSEIVAVLEPYATQIVDNILKSKHRELPSYAAYELMLLLQLGAKWDKILVAINNNKTAIVKYLLTTFKDENSDDVMLDSLHTDVDRLQRFGFAWPELAIIKKSIETELDARGLLETSKIAEAQPVIPQKLIKIFNRHLNNIYERGIDKLAYLIIDMKNAGATDQQIASLLSEKRQEIVKILRNTIHNESPKNWRAINEFAVAIASLLDLGIKWPPLLELLNYYRDKIEAWAIAAVFDAGFGKHVAEKLRKFEQLGFDILPIRRAIKANTLPTLTEYLATHGIDHYTVAKLEAMHRLNLLPKALDDKTTKLVFDAIENSMSKGMPNDFKNALKYFAMMNIPNLESTVKSIIEANKTPVIKSLLTAMKTGLGNANNYYVLPTYYIVDTLQLLHKLGIQWLELAAITRSLKAGY